MLKNKSKRIFTMGLSAVLGSCMLITGVGAATGTKKIDAYYNNIKVEYNGQQKYLSQEPFMYNNTVYVPVRGISEISGAEVKWGNNTVTINQDGATGGGATNDAALAEKNFQISKLTAENAELKKKLEQYEGTGGTTTGSSNITSQALSITEKYLRDNYDDTYDVEWDIALTQKGSKLLLTVEYDSKYFGREFKNVTERELKGLLEDLCEETQKRHKDIEINGKLVDVNRNFTAATFDMSKSGRYSFERKKEPATLSSFGSKLRSDYPYIKDLKAKTDSSDTKNFTLNVSKIELDESNGYMHFKVYADFSEQDRKDWNNRHPDTENIVKYYMENIADKIDREYSVDEIEGSIVNYSNDRDVLANYYYEDDKCRLSSF